MGGAKRVYHPLSFYSNFSRLIESWCAYCVVSDVSTKKYLDPNSGTFMSWNDSTHSWEDIAIDAVNVYEFLFISDYMRSEVCIEFVLDGLVDYAASYYIREGHMPSDIHLMERYLRKQLHD